MLLIGISPSVKAGPTNSEIPASFAGIADLLGMLEHSKLALNVAVIPPFLIGSSRRIQAAVFSFIAGVMPPMPMLGRSLL